MSNENDACRSPDSRDGSETAMMRRMLGTDRIAIVGASDRPGRASHMIARKAGLDYVENRCMMVEHRHYA